MAPSCYSGVNQGFVDNLDNTTCANLFECSGNCISDDHCREGLYCFDATDLGPVPGCKGFAEHGNNYCVKVNSRGLFGIRFY